MGLFKLLAAGCVAAACISQANSLVSAETKSAQAKSGQTKSDTRPVLKPAKARGSYPRAALAENSSVPAPSVMRCVAGWYGTSGMTKGDWHKACERATSDGGGIAPERALSLCVDAWEPATH